MNEKVIVFDLDETIGNFIQLYYIYFFLNKYFNTYKIYTEYIHSYALLGLLLDNLPLYLRPNILTIFQYLLENKKKINKIVIYSNNQISKEWIKRIAYYIEKKINGNIFDKVIGPYKIHEQLIEPTRTSFEKKYSDLLFSLQLQSTCDICFVDDVYHSQMKHPKVNYLMIPPYHYYYDNNVILSVLLKFFNIDNTHFINEYLLFMSRRQFTKKNYNVNSKQLLDKLKDFIR
jgi:hypothetical protein